MDLGAPAMIAAYVTSGSVLVAGLVTIVAQLWIARTHTAWEAALEMVKHDVARFEKAQDHLITAVDAANRYMFYIPDIDVTDHHQREPYILPILDSIGRAREEVAALPAFAGAETVECALTAIESLLVPPENGRAVRASWDHQCVREGVRALNRARSSRIHALAHRGRVTELRKEKPPGPRHAAGIRVGKVPEQSVGPGGDS
ncbi:hypothetical protein H181DRAFT_01685 [Streptomyces sp. WMMB 714]|uniref:hypothetical protein n=1 Tax=Streptomyces sp. WMMB 714 TaxID=1286822 RepID=UPI0005F82D32|nr:hypothetical protein [Streptomyces sp. WMMB 714]SCK22720.1 hypothetical protein H181DRAFT_01685 [Streptomyces sp. WMMB 714]